VLLALESLRRKSNRRERKRDRKKKEMGKGRERRSERARAAYAVRKWLDGNVLRL
jgi:hypothetical protein